jgi:hypothetical protein
VGIVLSSASGEAVVHSTVLLVCVAGGNVTPEVTWHFSGNPIQTDVSMKVKKLELFMTCDNIKPLGIKNVNHTIAASMMHDSCAACMTHDSRIRIINVVYIFCAMPSLFPWPQYLINVGR